MNKVLNRDSLPKLAILQHAGLALKSRTERISVIGLGYVGLPLCVAMARQYETVIGYDISERRVADLLDHHDSTNEVTGAALLDCTARFSTRDACLAEASFHIVTVPTPIDAEKRPDLQPLRDACAVLGRHLKPGDMVVFESTVYPGVTEDVCGPILEAYSGLVAGRDFHLGYSPERINPGDRERTIETITKIVAADSPAALDRAVAVYGRIVSAGIHRSPSIRVAECAKVIENTQRDVNIALMNELSLICDRAGIATADVIEAAGTKWNFQKFRPGLVGGHCIGVDPYYLSSLAERLNLQPEIILAGRRLNDRMAAHVASVATKKLVRRGGVVASARIGLFGMTFKENVPDIRNSKSFDLVRELRALGMTVMVHDPLADPAEMARNGAAPCDVEDMRDLDLMIVAVDHDAYLDAPDFLSRLRPDGVFIDIKAAFDSARLPRTASYWAL